MNDKVIAFPNAKINIGLFVCRRRPEDGYHILQTLFYPIDWRDALEILPEGEAGHCRLVQTGIAIGGDPEQNLCVKAYRRLQNLFPTLPGCCIHLEKRVPFGAGLGGGSSDGAYTLLLLRRLFDLPLTDNELVWDDGASFTDYGDPVPFVKELNDLFHCLDPTRLTTLAVCEDETRILGCSDLIAWNKYFGWYDRNMDRAEHFYDAFHANALPQGAGVSEYGAGASIRHHVDSVTCQDPFKPSFHPEERQNVVHEANWAIFRARPWMWGTFIWNLADFGSNVKEEGDRPGINDKGLVTYDRSVKKDAFYFYKAEWNSEPVVYITSRRHTERTKALTDVKVYSNQPWAVLYVNGVKVGKALNDGMSRIIWHDVALRPGDNEIKVVSGKGKNEISDSCNWTLQ